MIAFENKFIFVHIYKTAGTSVMRALYPFASGLTLSQKRANKYAERLLGRTVYAEPAMVLWKHAGANEYRVFLGDRYSDFFSFAFVRNPFDWQVSLYEYIRQSPKHLLYRMARELEFKDFLKSRVSETQRPQKDFVCDADGRLIVDKIGRFESIDDDFRDICSEISVDASLPHLNESQRNPVGRYYDVEARDIVLRNLEPDFEMFGYSEQL